MIAQLAALIGQPCLVAGKGTDAGAVRGTVTDVKLAYGMPRLEVRRESLKVTRSTDGKTYSYAIGSNHAWVDAARVYLIEADGTTLRPCVTA